MSKSIITLPNRALNIRGLVFGRLIAIAPSRKHRSGMLWHCVCACGNLTERTSNELRRPKRHSCGCLAGSYGVNVRKMKGYNTWCKMKSRCYSRNSPDYQWYGARGITVCDEWRKSFLTFHNDMGEKPAGKSLDRIDNEGNYCKDNCKWSTPKEQAGNRRSNIVLSHNGNTMILSDLAKATGLPYSVIHERITRGWSVSRALETPILTKYRNKK